MVECALRWVVQIDDQLKKYRAALADYTDDRFAYALHILTLLTAAVAKQTKGAGSVEDKRTAADLARSAAVEAHKSLLEACGRYAGKRDVLQKEIASSPGTADIDGLPGALNYLASLAEAWLALDDERAKFLARNARLTPELVAAARSAAAVLAPATGEVVLQGPLQTRDTPETNLVEGAMLLEMLYVWRIFNAAADKTGLVKRLVPNPSIAHVFTRPTGPKGKGAPTGDGATPD